MRRWKIKKSKKRKETEETGWGQRNDRPVDGGRATHSPDCLSKNPSVCVPGNTDSVRRWVFGDSIPQEGLGTRTSWVSRVRGADAVGGTGGSFEQARSDE